jgi:alginate O-acetyltransferase complex protein AlgI
MFYGAWSWEFLLLLLASTVLDYVCGLLIAGAASRERKRFVMLVSVTANLLFLATFKYLGFFVAEFAALLERLGFDASLPVLEIVLPVGISFYTFQTIGYIVDVYRGKAPATRSFLDYALYVAFFPQLVAGPIERAGNLIPQFQKARVWSTAAFEAGLQLAIWGLFKKVVIADNLAPMSMPCTPIPRRTRAPRCSLRASFSRSRSTATSRATRIRRAVWHACSASSSC